MAADALAALSPEPHALAAKGGRPSIWRQRLPKAALVIALSAPRSERAFPKQQDYRLLFRCFLDLQLRDPSFTPSSLTKNRARANHFPSSGCNRR